MGEAIMKLGPRVTDATAAWLESHFSSRGAGAEFLLECFPELYRRALHNLKGRFSAGELSLMVDMLNATWIMPNLAGQHLLTGASDSMSLDGTDVKWGVDGPALIDKIQGLTLFERACLEIWARAFWEQDSHDNLPEWVSRLT
jgi:hypothetical protein